MSYVFTFGDSNTAIAAEHVLLESDLKPSVMPLVPQIGKGCGFCLRLEQDQAEAAKQALAMASIQFSVFRRTPSQSGFEYTKIQDL